MARPVDYAHATRMSREAQACLDFARLVWLDLSPTMQKAMIDTVHGLGSPKISTRARVATRRALRVRGLVIAESMRLTHLGLLVREAGTRARVES